MEEKNTEINIIISILIFILIAVSVVFLLPGKKSNTKAGSSVEIYKPQITESQAADSPDARSYTVKLENNMLNFYLNAPDGRHLIESSPINTEIYPAEDIRELSASITVNTLEEGIGIFEDFTT